MILIEYDLIYLRLIAFTVKLDIFAEKSKNRETLFNERLDQRVNQVPMIRERQVKFTGQSHCMPTDESINSFVLYESKLRPGALTRTYRKKIVSPSKWRENARSKGNMKDSGEQI